MNDAPTKDQIASACLSFRHDFGLLPVIEQMKLMQTAQEWWRVLQKEGCITRAEAEAMVAAEREAAAYIADAFEHSAEERDWRDGATQAKRIAAAIRARKRK